MGYSVSYHAGQSKQCTRPGCEAVGGMLVAGQLVINTQDGDTQNTRHFDCLSKDQKRAARKRVKGPSDLPGYRNLKAEDKRRVREAFGWNEDAQSTQSGQNNKGRADEKTEAKGKGKAKTSEREPQENAPRSSRQHIETRPISPAHSQSWFSNVPSWDDSEPPKAPQGTFPSGRGKEREGGNKQDGRRNAQPEARVQPVPASAGPLQQANTPSRSKQTGNQDLGNRNPPAPKASDTTQIIGAPGQLIQIGGVANQPNTLGRTAPIDNWQDLESRNPPAPKASDITPVMDSPVANSGPPAPPKAEIDPAVLMRLELEDKEAEARLAEAELLLAEARVKVETARRAVVAQKLMMARAGVSPTS